MILPVETKRFTPTQFRANSSTVFNSVQSDGMVVVESKSRPDMVLMLKSDHAEMIEKIKQLTDLIKAQG